MTDQHPITPPPELIYQWRDSGGGFDDIDFATQAARWGADQELEACINWLDRNNQWARVDLDELRDGRRPKPPNRKQRALNALAQIENECLPAELADEIRAALETLPDD
jgi:hypothetical protein